jgi:hypothetical protein
MHKLLLSLLPILCLFYNASSASGVVINESNGHTYFHLAHTLEMGDFTLIHPDEYFDPKYPDIAGECKFASNGSFTLYINKASFPIPAPNCNSRWLKVTMKGGKQSGVESKHTLWKQIQRVETGELDTIEVIIELNPYISIVNNDPLELELDYCNLWFRTAHGEYVAHTESFKAQP